MFQLRCLVLKELVFTFARQRLGPIPPGIASVASSGWPGLPDWQLYTGSPGHWGHCQDRPDKSISKQSPVSSSSSEQPSVWGDNHPSFPQTHSCSVLLTGIMLRKLSPVLSQDSVTQPRLPGPEAGLTLTRRDPGLPGTDWSQIRGWGLRPPLETRGRNDFTQDTISH